MNKKTLTKLITLSLITSSALYATNGDHLIAVGAKARGMGGASIGLSHGAESGLSNPALITSVEGTEIGFGGTLFMPKIETQMSYPANTAYTSDADTNMIPEISIAHKIDDNWFIGIGMWGTAGMGVDYRDATFNPTIGQMGNFNMVTNLQLMQFGVPIAYKTGGLSLAITPILQYGNLDINYNPSPVTGNPTGAGLAQDFGFGYNLGIAYDLTDDGIAGLTIGALYKSAIEMEYKGQLSTAMAGFGVAGFSDILEQPAEIGVGLSYVLGEHTIAFDYKKIQWSSTKGYGDFGWEDQDVYALGYQYTQDNWALRTGINYAQSPIVELGATGALYNTLNLLGFPGTSETHYTLGGSYALTEAFSVDLAYVYSPESSETFTTTAVGVPITTTHTENSLSFQLAYKL
jgi:long-chain fatty acid transport protein